MAATVASITVALAAPSPIWPRVKAWAYMKVAGRSVAKPGKVHLRIEKSGRSGKTVTVLFGEGVERLDAAGREGLLKSLKGSLGCGGTVEGAALELQGDVRERAGARLRALGWPAK